MKTRVEVSLKSVTNNLKIHTQAFTITCHLTVHFSGGYTTSSQHPDKGIAVIYSFWAEDEMAAVKLLLNCIKHWFKTNDVELTNALKETK